MANRHNAQKRASGGRTFYAGGGSNVAKEAFERKRGGRTYKTGGAVAKARFDKGGSVKKATGGAIKRASGGRAGSDQAPYSSARLKGG